MAEGVNKMTPQGGKIKLCPCHNLFVSWFKSIYSISAVYIAEHYYFSFWGNTPDAAKRTLSASVATHFDPLALAYHSHYPSLY